MESFFEGEFFLSLRFGSDSDQRKTSCFLLLHHGRVANKIEQKHLLSTIHLSLFLLLFLFRLRQTLCCVLMFD